jgi:2,4-dienoyl-CoA reductase-like NADH-dependent reductase (Old Yellow Enzyme family)
VFTLDFQWELFRRRYRPLFQGTLITKFGFDLESANELVQSGDADLVSFARHFIENSDVPERLLRNALISAGNRDTHFTQSISSRFIWWATAFREVRHWTDEGL